MIGAPSWTEIKLSPVFTACRQLPSLPFIADQEFEELYGEEVALAFRDIENLNQAEMICGKCDGTCCQKHGCEFYTPQFSQCPIHDLRPAICRFHFCEKFRTVGGSTIKDLSEIFLYSLSAAATGSRNVKFFNPPPFTGILPGLIEIIQPMVNGARSGELKPEDAQRCIRKEVMKYNP
jgi:hypothetical protein